MTQSYEPFDIRDYTDQLEKSEKEKGKYICPNCGGHNFTINKSTGAYGCWNGCESEDIRERVSSWEDKKRSRSGRWGVPRRATKPKGKIRLLKSGVVPPYKTSAGAIPGWLVGQGVPRDAITTKYTYSDTQIVRRYDWEENGKPKKTIRQFSFSDGKFKAGKGNELWPFYNRDAIANSEQAKQGGWVAVVEGEKCVIAASKS